jgi:predicted transcriptional regulator
MTHISLNLPDELAERLRRLAAESQSTTEALLLGAARDLVAAREGLDAMIARGEADFAGGRVVSHEEVMREMEEWAAGIRARHDRG